MTRFEKRLKEENDTIDYLIKCDKNYHDSDKPLISDTAYDRLKSKALEDYPENSYFKSIGTSISDSGKVNLPYVLGSLTKFKLEDINKKLNRDVLYVVSEKLDGMSILCTWVNGKIVFASTRGNGTVGQDITEKAKIIVPDIPVMDKITLRCEFLLTGDSHTVLGYKNRRNGIVGIINNKEPLRSSLVLPKAVFYEYIDGPEVLKYEHDRLKYIKDTLGLDTPSFKLIKNSNNTELTNLLIDYKINTTYDIDGLVITLNDSTRENVLYPKNKISYKVNEDAVETTVKDIEWNVGRTGRVIPVVNIEPIDIDGTTISRATGFNAKFIIDNEINTGAKVGIIKSGQVIPYLCEIIEKSDTKIKLTNCPSCGSMLVWRGVDIVCENPKCKKMMITKIAHYFKLMSAEFITIKTVDKLGVSSIEDMYNLKESDIIDIDGFGKKKSDIIINEIKKTLNTTPAELLSSFGIPSIGKRMSQVIMKSFTFDELFDSICYDRLELGVKTKEKFINNINKFKPLYDFLLSKGLTFNIEDVEVQNMLSDAKLVLTGKAPYKRNVMVSLIEKNGGTVSSAVSKTTTYLVTSDVDSTTGKTKKAKELGINIMTYDMLLDKMGEKV